MADDTARALQQPWHLKLGSHALLAVWCVIAAFPLLWIAVMSFRVPRDAFAGDPLQVLTGPLTLERAGGLSVIDIVFGLAFAVAVYQVASKLLGAFARSLGERGIGEPLGWVVASTLYVIAVAVLGVVVLPALLDVLNELAGPIGEPVLGATFRHYQAVWWGNEFYVNFLNSLTVTFGVVIVSLTVGTLAGYALARTRSTLAFWILIIALIFRALPHSVLVTGYLPVFVNSAQYLEPLLGAAAPTLYGQPLAVIAVLVAINQPFTIWMLRSFFMNIPAELDEAARVDGCSPFQAFRLVIMPVMWPGVITTGLFSFLLAYNDYLVTSLLLDSQNMTMVPAITNYFNRETTLTDQVRAVAAAVSITAPLFVLVMVFQRQIVSGLTAGAVKG